MAARNKAPAPAGVFSPWREVGAPHPGRAAAPRAVRLSRSPRTVALWSHREASPEALLHTPGGKEAAWDELPLVSC